MNLRFHQLSAGNQPLPPETVPVSLSGQLIDGASLYYASIPAGYILSQELRINGFVIGYYVISLKSSQDIQVSYQQEYAVLHYMLTGNLHFQINRNKYRVNENQNGLLIIPPGSPVTLNLEKGKSVLLQIHFSMLLLKKLSEINAPFHALPGVTDTAFLFLLLTANKRTGTLWKNLLLKISEKPFPVAYINNQCMNLVQRFMNDFNLFQHQQAWVKKKELKLHHLEGYIETNLSAPHKLLTMRELARKMGLSKHAFSTLFYKTFAATPTIYIQTKRMKHAKQLLSTTNMNTGQVALATGYNDLSSFSRAFKKYHGHVPSSVNRPGKR